MDNYTFFIAVLILGQYLCYNVYRGLKKHENIYILYRSYLLHFDEKCDIIKLDFYTLNLFGGVRSYDDKDNQQSIYKRNQISYI